VSKDYSKGNKDGHEDGKTGDNRLALRGAKRLLNIGSYLPGAENRDGQYIKGYVAGFQDEVRVSNVKLAPQGQSSTRPTGEQAMSNATSFAHQIELLLNLKQYLLDFQERLLGVSANYQRKVDALHGAGLMDETYRDFVEREVETTRAMITRLVDNIGASDIPAVEREIAYLERKL